MFRYASPAARPVASAISAEVTVPPFAVMKAGLYDEAKVMSSVLSKVPLVTPRGKPMNVGVVVATIAVPVKGAGVALFRACAQQAVALGCGRMEWLVLDWNELALGFYRRLGARTMDEWVTHRLDGAALARVAAEHINDRVKRGG